MLLEGFGGAALFPACGKTGLQAHFPLPLNQLVRQVEEPFLIELGRVIRAFVGGHHGGGPEVPLSLIHILRVVVRQGTSRDMIDMLIDDIKNAVAELEKLEYRCV